MKLVRDRAVADHRLDDRAVVLEQDAVDLQEGRHG